MRVCADSSFLLRLVSGEPGAEQAGAGYRRLGRPAVFYLPLHALEVDNGIRQRAFHERRALGSTVSGTLASRRDRRFQPLWLPDRPSWISRPPFGQVAVLRKAAHP